MNDREKLQKFSIRKYTVGTFSTVIATLVFLGFNASNAQAEEESAKEQTKTQIYQHQDGQQSNSSDLAKQETNKISQTTDKANTNVETSTDNSSQESTKVANLKKSNQSEQNSSNSSKAPLQNSENTVNKNQEVTNSSDLEQGNTLQNEQLNHAENKLTAHVEDSSRQIDLNNNNDNAQPSQIDKNALQAFFDANYHDYRFVDREKADKTTFNQVKAAFDKINLLLGSNDELDNKTLQLAYKELEQAVATIKTLPKRQAQVRRNHRIEERSVEPKTSSVEPKTSSVEPRVGSDYQNALSGYYVSSEIDGSGYPVGTFVSASNRDSPNVPARDHFNILHAAESKEYALMSAKQLKDGYEWTIKFNRAYVKHDKMVFWFGLPEGQTPVGETRISIVDRDHNNIISSTGAGAGLDKPLPEFWSNGDQIDRKRAYGFDEGPPNGHTFYEMSDIQIYNFKDLARPSGYFTDQGASDEAKSKGYELLTLLNGENKNEIPGLSRIYAFIGKGDSSYTITFKTTGSTSQRLYYAAGARAYEDNQYSNYSQLYVEPLNLFTERMASTNQIVNRSYRIGNKKQIYDPATNSYKTKLVLESNNFSQDYASDPLSYIKSPTNDVLGFFNPDLNYNGKRDFTPQPLNEFEISQLFTDEKLRESLNSGRPIRLLIGFNYRDRYQNEQTLTPAYLTVLPELRYNILFFTNDEILDRALLPISQSAGHPVFALNPGEMQNSTSTSGGKTIYNQPLRINLVSNAPFTDSDWSITGIPKTLRIQSSVDRVNTAYEKNIELVGHLDPGIYFATVRFGKNEQQFEIRVKPPAPHIVTTAEELHGKGGEMPRIVIDNVPNDPTALVYLITSKDKGKNGTNDPASVPTGYATLGTQTPTYDSHTVVIEKNNGFVFPLPPTGGNIKAIVFYNKNVQSNWGNVVPILPDDTPPTISNPVGIEKKYYRGENVSFTVNVSDERYGTDIKNVNVTNLPSGWTTHLEKSSDGISGVLTISGTIPNNQTYNSQLSFAITATDNANNTSQAKQVSLNVGKMSQDFEPVGLDNAEKIKVSDPMSISFEELLQISQSLLNKNANLKDKLAKTNNLAIGSNGSAQFTYKDGSTDHLSPSQVITYEPIRNAAYASGDNLKQATIVIAKGQAFNFGELQQYFTLEDGAALPNNLFYNISAINPLPTPSEISHLDVGTYDYQVQAANAYHQNLAPLTLSLKVIDVNEPTDDQRVYRISKYQLTDDEVTRVKQAFINANSHILPLTKNDITVNNPLSDQGVSTVTVTVTKGKLVKSFTSNGNHMSFLRWVDFPNDYQVSWTSPRIENRPTDGGLEWTPDHKSLIYRYDATLGQDFNTNEVLNLLVANTNIPGLRTNIAGTEKEAAEAGGRPTYSTTGYSLTSPQGDGQRFYTLDDQPIQVLDIVTTNTGIGGQTITYSNLSNNSHNSTLMSVNKPAINGADAFTIDKVIKNNTISNVHNAIYRAQLYLAPTGPKPYIENLNSTLATTTDTINVYFVPSDKVNPTISVDNPTNQQIYSGETYTNHITANDNYELRNVTVTPTSQITGNVSNNNQVASFVVPNVTRTTNKTINLIATDTSGNSTEHSFNIAIKPLKDKYRVSTTSTAQNPVRIANISNNASISQEDQEAITNSVTLTEIVPNRSYATASTNEVQSKTVSNVHRRGNNADVTVTVIYKDGTTSTVNVPVKHTLNNVIAKPRYTVQGQNFPNGKGSSPSDFFTLENGNPIPDATITWLTNNTPNKNNSTIGENITVRANILFDGETSPIVKESSYMVVRTIPKKVFVAPKLGTFPDITDVNNAKEYMKPINNSWSDQPNNMTFTFIGNNGEGPNTRQIGFQTRQVRVTYANGQTEDVKFLAKIRPDAPVIDASSVSYKAGLTNQEIKLSNVLTHSPITLLKADGTPLTITKTTYGNDRTAIITVSDALPDGEIKAHAAMSESNLTYTSLNDRGQVTNERHSETVDSLDSDSVRVTPQLQAIDEGAVLVKGGNNFDFNHAERFIKSAPNGTTATWQDNPDNWKNNVGSFTKTITVTLPNGQGTRTVDIPVKIYPSAVAISPARDKKGTNLTHGTQAINYITFEPNQNTTGITAEWANNTAPDSNTAGVQNLTINVNYPGISTPVQVPVKVYVYQFDFPQSEYTTTIGTTLASGIDASQYAHNENGDGLPTDGFTYRWNKTATGTNNASWAAMNKPNATKVVNATYDVLYNGRTFATSQPAKFIVKNVQPTKPTISETAQGVITITPGNDQRINTSSGNVTTYADRLVIKRNGNIITSFSRNNNRSPWTKEQSAQTVAGLVGAGNGITVAAGTFNPADTIQVIATQGSGELTSAEQPSDEFIVVAPQPNQVLSTAWDNGQLDITPNNPTGNLVNPTNAVDISYTEKIANSAEQNKILHVVKGANGKWSIADQPSYITLDSATGKVTFNANSIKPNSEVTAVAKAGSGNVASSNSRTLTSPAEHTVTTDQIIKEFGVNVTADEINNAVHVNNKRNAVIKEGTNIPTNLAGGSTTTIPVIITYNDGSTEEVNETIFTKSDKRELITANAHLDDAISTDGKTPSSINQYNQAITAAEQQINAAKAEANQVIQNQFASPQQVSDALTKVQAAQTEIDQAKALLQDKADNSELVTAKNNLQAAVDQVPSTDGMTQQSINDYNRKQQAAQTAITNAQQVINNGDATAQEIAAEKTRVNNALAKLKDAKAHLTADTTALQQAVQQLDRTGSTTDKKPASITAYNQAMQALNSDLTTARNNANAVINKPIRTVQEVQDALTAVNRVNEQITQAIDQLQPLADNSELKAAKAKLDAEINKSVSTDGMTQESINAYQTAKQTAQAESNNAQQVIDNGDATDQDIAAEKANVETQYNNLKQAITNLTPDKAPLEAAKTDLENDIYRSTSTTGMTADSVAKFNEKRNAAQQALEAITQVLQGNPDVATIRDNVTQANNAKSALDTARDGLTVDKAPLETAKNELQQSITQAQNTSTTGMTQATVNAFNTKLTAAKEKLQAITQVLNGSPTVADINTNTSQTNSIKSELDQARTNLTPDKAPLEAAKNALQQSITQAEGTNTTGMTQDTVHAFNSKLNSAKEKIKAITNILKGHPTVEQISENTSQTNSVKTELDNARTNLTPDKAPLAAAKQALQQSIHQAENTSTTGMTQSTINTFNEKLNAAKEKLNVITQVLNNNPSVSDINTNTDLANTAKTALDTARNSLTVDKAPLEAAKQSLQKSISQAENTSTTGMTQGTVNTFNTKLAAAKEKLQAITQVLNGSPTVADINTNTNQANVTKVALDNARNGLTVDKTPLETAKQALQQSISQAESTSTTGMTQDTVNAFDAKLNTAKEKIKAITNVLNGNPSVAEINTNTSQTNSIKSELDQARTNLTPDKAPLESAKQALELSIHQPTDTVGMTTASLNEYNQKLEAARQTLNAVNQELAGQPSVQTINDKVAQATNAQSELDQARAGLTLDRQPTIEALQHATSLNQAQKDNFREQINAAPNHAGLETIQNNINALNTAMTALRDSINDNDSIKTGINYTDATSSNRTNYDNAVNAAKDIIGEQNNATMSPDTVNQKANTVKSTKAALDGEQNLQRAKQEAIDTITNANDLNQAQKNALTQQVSQAKNVQAANDIKQNATALDTAMTNLKQGVAKHAQLVQDDNYVNADTKKKNAYDTAYNQANEIINGNAQNPTLIPNDVTNALQQVSQAETALNGSDNLNNAKQEAQTALGQLTHLNDAQRQQLQTQINDAHQVDSVNAVKQLASNLDTAMDNLQNAIANNDTVKRGEDYLDADNEKQNNYNQAVLNAKQIISETTQPTMTVDAINQAINQVTSTKDALNGEEKLEQAKQQANNELNTLSHLNNAQKADITSKINDATNIANVNSVKQSANNLNTAMGNLQDAISNENDTLNSQNYRDASSDKQTNYTTAVNEAKAILAQNGPNKSQDQVNAAIAKVNTAKSELNGNRNLEQAQQTAKQALSQLTHLTDAQKDHLTTQINNSTTVAEVQGIQGNANTLDQAMDTLKQSIADQNTVRNSEDYNDASPDNQNAYNNAVTTAEDIINASTNPEMSADTINAKTQQVLHAKGDLNGDENLLAAKQNAQQYLDTLSHITNQQKDNLNTQITNAQNISQVEQVKQNAQSLDTAMNNLQNVVNNENQVKATENYTDADTNKQTTYNEAIAAAKAILNRDAGPNTPQNYVETALQRITNAQNELNGDHKINDAKTAAIQHLGTLNHLTTAQHNALENDINQATNLADVEQVKQNADALNTSMRQLQTLVDDKNNVQNSQNYLDADSQNQSNYDMYLVTAESTVNKTTGPNTSKADVDTLIGQINQAEQALNGQQNLDQAKQSAINTIDQSTNLNTAQKDTLKAQVTSGNRVADVNGVKQLATTLNTSMGNLRQSIANKAETLTNGNYINADNDKRNAYDTQVANAESIINGTNNVVLVPTDIDNATTSVTNAYNALNGDNNLRVAKENANNTIDGLAQLNNVQKANLKEQVQNAQTLPNVQTVKTNAQTLNNAMRTLRDSVANEQTVKSSQNYTDANQDLQQAYDAQVNNANNIINETGTPTMDPNTITQAATQVTAAEGALNGAQNLIDAQNNAKANLNTLSHLTNAQKESITNQINSATHVNDVTTIQNDATQLNNAMGELAQVIQDQESTKQQVNYTNADQANQEAYNNAVAEAERILDKEHGANTSHADVQIAIQNVQSAKQALNGDRNVEIAKTNAKNALEQLTSLNNAQKAALTTQIDNAPTVANVEQVSNTATHLNQAMAKLQQGINDNNDVLQSVDYTDADPTNQQAYTNAVTQANAILSKDQGTNADITQVQAALNQVTTAKNALNGEEKVAQAKEAAKQALATYNHLNTAQTNAATEQITNATTLAQVAQAQNTANELNTAMGELQNSINDQATVKNSVNFTDADQTNQEAYTNAVTEAKSILDYAHGGNLNKEQVEAVTNKVSTAKENLNGDAKVREAKADALNNLGTLNQLNDVQKAHLTNAINSASTVDGVNQVKTTAQNLNSAMQQLQQAIANKAETLNSQNYLDANTDKKNAYTGAVANAESILDKTSGTNADQNAVEQAIQNVTQTASELNGIQNLQIAKNDATQAIENLAHLNTPQKMH